MFEVLTSPFSYQPLVTEFKGHEAFSEFFDYRVTVVLPAQSVDCESVLGKTFSFTLTTSRQQKQRYYSGIIASIRVGLKAGNGLQSFTLFLHPHCFKLSLLSDCRIFQSQSVLEIARSLFQENNLALFNEAHLNHDYPSIPYCVQYGETHWHFIQRLWSKVGIYFYFIGSHENSQIVLHDAPILSSARPIKDYRACQKTYEAHPVPKFELRMRTGDAGLQCGDCLQLDRPWTIVDLRHMACNPIYETQSHTQKKQTQSYDNEVIAIPSDQLFVPPKKVKPKIYGVQTAVVVAQRSNSVKVRFHWDRREGGASNELTVMPPWSGKKFGMQWLPRPGQEVVVSFIQGDPDQPVVIGSVYNAFQTLTYPQSQQRYFSGLRAQGGQELRFSEQSGSLCLQLSTPGDMFWNIAKVCQYSVKGDFNLQIFGDTNVEVTQGSYIVEVSQSLSLKAGNSILEIKPDAIHVSAPKVHFKTGALK